MASRLPGQFVDPMEYGTNALRSKKILKSISHQNLSESGFEQPTVPSESVIIL